MIEDDEFAAAATSRDMGEVIWRSDVDAGSRRHQAKAAPAEHFLQDDCPVSEVYNPRGHSSHAASSTSLYLPALQSLQGSPLLPGAHDTGSLLHASLVPLPGRELGRFGNVFRHDLHVKFEVAPGTSEKVLAGH